MGAEKLQYCCDPSRAIHFCIVELVQQGCTARSMFMSTSRCQGDHAVHASKNFRHMCLQSPLYPHLQYWSCWESQLVPCRNLISLGYRLPFAEVHCTVQSSWRWADITVPRENFAGRAMGERALGLSARSSKRRRTVINLHFSNLYRTAR